MCTPSHYNATSNYNYTNYYKDIIKFNKIKIYVNVISIIKFNKNPNNSIIPFSNPKYLGTNSILRIKLYIITALDDSDNNNNETDSNKDYGIILDHRYYGRRLIN